MSNERCLFKPAAKKEKGWGARVPTLLRNANYDNFSKIAKNTSRTFSG